jgi:hypothetical protein
MPQLHIDLSQARSFDPVEAGTYEMRIESVEGPERSSTKGTLGVWVYFSFLDPEFQRKHGNQRRFYPIEGEGAGFFRDLWKAVTGESLPIGQAVSVDTDELVGAEVIVTFGPPREYEGGLFSDLQSVVKAA